LLASFPLQTAYARVDLAVSLISTLDFTQPSGECNVSLRNGDVLKGKIDIKEVNLRTSFGDVTVPLELVRRVKVFGSGVSFSGLLLHFPFEFLSDGRVADKSGNDHHGVIHAKRVGIQRASDGALYFTGTREYIECGPELGLGEQGAFTMLFWMKPDQWERRSSGVISMKENDGTPGIVIYSDGFYPTKLNVRVHGTQGIEKGTDFGLSRSDVRTGVWQQWAVAYDPAVKELIIYLNGERDTVYRSIDLGSLRATAAFRVGTAQTWDVYYKGWMKNLMVFDRPLDPSEISSLHHSQRP
jgi:hypothetical protein